MHLQNWILKAVKYFIKNCDEIKLFAVYFFKKLKTNIIKLNNLYKLVVVFLLIYNNIILFI